MPEGNEDCDGHLFVSERLLRLLLMLCGALLWSYVLSRAIDVIVQGRPDEKHFRQSVDELNRFVAIHQVSTGARTHACPPRLLSPRAHARGFRAYCRHCSRHCSAQLDTSLARRMREYLHKTRHIDLVKSYHHVYDRLSTQLRSEVALCACRELFEQCFLLSEASNALRTQIAHSVQGDVFAPSEVLPCTNVYAMHRGIVVIDGIVRASRRVFGIPSLMYSHALRSSTHAVAFTYCEVLFIDGHVLRELAEKFDVHTARRMKLWAAFEALRIFMVRELRQKKAQEASKVGRLSHRLSLAAIGRGRTLASPVVEMFNVLHQRRSSKEGVNDGATSTPSEGGGWGRIAVRTSRRSRVRRTGSSNELSPSSPLDSAADLTADPMQEDVSLADSGEAGSSVTRRRVKSPHRRKLGARQSPRPQQGRQVAFELRDSDETLPFVQMVPRTPHVLTRRP